MTGFEYAQELGYVRELIVHAGIDFCQHVLVKEDADLESEFVGYVVDTDEYLVFNGWLCGFEEE